MRKRDGEVASLAGQLGLQGLGDAPFPAKTVRQFLADCGRRVREQEDRAMQEKVRVHWSGRRIHVYRVLPCIQCFLH